MRIGSLCLAAALVVTACGTSSDPLVKGSPEVASSGPVQILIEGDSIAFTLGIGLSGAENEYGVQIDDRGGLGCGIAQGNPIMLNDALDSLPSSCDTWQTSWKDDVAKGKPDVVAILVGRWEIVDRMRGGKWEHIGQASFDTYLQSQIDAAVHIAGAGGAKVVLLTMPYLYPAYSSNGTMYPESDPHRVDQFNAMLRSEAKKYPGTVSVIDLNSLLDPGGQYTSVIDGVQTRIPPSQQGDWNHISVPGGELLGPTILPQLAKLGVEARRSA